VPFLETILAQEGELPFLPWHQRRLERTLLRHGIAADYRLADLLAPPRQGRWRCRVVYDAGGMRAEYLPYTPRIVKTLRAVEDDRIAYRDKTTERGALEALFALRGGADDVLIVQEGLITDTTVANVACLLGGEWLTPASVLLEGTARARLLFEGRLREADITLAEARTAEKIAVMNALSGFVEVTGGILPET
jgi:4-amino-4-deoxychorismate lyase